MTVLIQIPKTQYKVEVSDTWCKVSLWLDAISSDDIIGSRYAILQHLAVLSTRFVGVILYNIPISCQC